MISVLGISAFYHDSAAALVQDGKIIAAAKKGKSGEAYNVGSGKETSVNLIAKIIVGKKIRVPKDQVSQINPKQILLKSKNNLIGNQKYQLTRGLRCC